jgi:regulator of cell morphogenesis and NO signaling
MSGISQSADWTVAPLRDLIDHLVSSDHIAFRGDLNRLQAQMEKVVALGRDNDSVLSHLSRIFSNLKRELEVHMYHEETGVFPEIEKYESAAEAGQPLPGSPFAAFGGPVNVMEMEHENAGAALRLIRDFCNDYTAPSTASPEYRALVDGLRELDDKIQVHMQLENNVLFPRASALRLRKTRLV